jgi:S1-C subfamily serine protease
MTVSHLVDGCLRIDLFSEGLPTTKAGLMSLTTAPEAAMLRIPEMPAARPPVMLTFRPLADPPTVPGTKLTVLGFPSGEDLSKPTVIEMTDITDSVPKPPKVRSYVLVQGEGAAGFSGAPILNSRGQVVAVFMATSQILKRPLI